MQDSELLFDDVVDLRPQRIDVGRGQMSCLDRFMDDNAGVTLVEQLRTRWPHLPRAVDRHRNDGKARGYCHAERSLLERVQFAVAAPRSFRKYDERIPVLLGIGDALVDRRIGGNAGTPVDFHDSRNLEGLSKDGNLVELFLCEVSDRCRDGAKEQWYVKVGEMIGQKEVLSIRFEVFGSCNGEAERRHEQEHSTPHLDSHFADPAQPQAHEQDEEGRNDDGEQDEQRYQYRRFDAQEDLPCHRGSVVHCFGATGLERRCEN